MTTTPSASGTAPRPGAGARTAVAPTLAQAHESIAAGTGMDAVTLLVGDLDTQLHFYRDVLRLAVVEQPVDRLGSGPAQVTLGRGTTPLVVLRHTPDLPPARRGSAGLFHTALLFDDRADLAETLLSVARHAPGTYTGSADHLVSLAFYLTDPEGNGVELYWDRPRDEWRHTADGGVLMDSLRLDPNEFLGEHLGEAQLERLEQAAPDPAPVDGETVVGHVHLSVGDVPSGRAFYVDALGFDVTAQWHGALFVSAGGYHHHMAMNTWNSRGSGKRRLALGLGMVDIVVPTSDHLGELGERMSHFGVQTRHDGQALSFDDPWANTLTVRAA